MQIDKDSILDIMPIENEGEQMDAFQTTSALEEQEQFPEILSYNPVLYGWELVALRAIHKNRMSTFNKDGAGSATQSFPAKAGFPILIPAVAVEFTTDSDEIQGNIRVDVTRTSWVGGFGSVTDYWEGQFKGLTMTQKGEKEERIILFNHFSRPLFNAKLDGLPTLPTQLQRYVPITHVLANEATDAAVAAGFNPIQNIEVAIISSVATLKHSVEVICPGGKLWNVYVEAMLAHKLSLLEERYSVKQDQKSLILGS